MPDSKVYVIGIAPSVAESLSQSSRRIIERAELVFGGERLLNMFPSLACEKVVIKNNLSEVVSLIRSNAGLKGIVVLSSGDPDFFGIARYLREKLGKEALEIVPGVSAMQLAFARIGESWDDAALVSVHSRPIDDVLETLLSNDKAGIFTDEYNTPAAIANTLLRHGAGGYKAYVCQDIGTKNERIIETDLPGLSRMKCSPLNTLILLKDRKEPLKHPFLGISDNEFYQRTPKEGLITKLEVRVISLAKLRLNEHSTVWDIGAGSGAISIEASILVKNGRIYAIERNAPDIAIIKKNILKFGGYNINVVMASAPDRLDELPEPSAVFIGGSGGRMAEIVDYACRRIKPGGRIVINVATLENLHHAANSLKENGFTAETTLVNISRSKDISDLTRLEALNPVFIVAGWQEKESGNAE